MERLSWTLTLFLAGCAATPQAPMELIGSVVERVETSDGYVVELLEAKGSWTLQVQTKMGVITVPAKTSDFSVDGQRVQFGNGTLEIKSHSQAILNGVPVTIKNHRSYRANGTLVYISS